VPQISLRYVVQVVYGAAKVYVFSPYAVIDRTGLELSIRGTVTAEGASKSIERKTFSNTPEISSRILDMLTAVGESESVIRDKTIQSFAVKSARKYSMGKMTVGSLVFSDRSLKWSNLPSYYDFGSLRKCETNDPSDMDFGPLYISTSCDDKIVRKDDFITFTVRCPAVVVLLHDAGLRYSPPWIEGMGYLPLVEHAVARDVLQGVMVERHFKGWGRYFDAQSEVRVHGNNSIEPSDRRARVLIP
jgi:hypothetical protein